MSLFVRGSIRINNPSAWFGAFVGAHIAILLAISFASVLLVPSRVDAQTKVATCFLPNECLKLGTTTNCDNEHCFEAGHGCPGTQGACYINPPAVPLAIRIGGTTRVLDIGDYIGVVYNYAVAIAGILAGVMIVVAGLQYLTAGGNDTRVKAAKERIKGALIGLAILFSAYLMLNTVNPDTLLLQMPKIEITKKMTISTCAYTENCAPCGVKYSVLTRRSDGMTATGTGQCEFTRLADAPVSGGSQEYTVSGQCVGKGCSATQVPGGTTACTSASYRCQQGTEAQFACGIKPDGAEQGFACQRCAADGAACGATGANDSCCGGYCADVVGIGHECRSGDPGDQCDDDKECKSGICQTEGLNVCSDGAIGSQCDSSSECKEGLKCQTSTSNSSCSPGTKYSICKSNDQCADGFYCLGLQGDVNLYLSGYQTVCMPKNIPNTRSDFKAAVCNPSLNGLLVDDCCNTNADCAGRGQFCNTQNNNFCTDGSLGAPCAGNEECSLGRCADNKCVSGEVGTSCDGNDDCESQKCIRKDSSKFGTCVSGGPGSKCSGATPCNAGLKCSADQRCIE